MAEGQERRQGAESAGGDEGAARGELSARGEPDAPARPAGGVAGGAARQVGHIPGTTTVDLADGSVGRFVVHPTVLLAHAVRLQGAVADVRGLLGDGEVDDADIAEAFREWGV